MTQIKMNKLTVPDSYIAISGNVNYGKLQIRVNGGDWKDLPATVRESDEVAFMVFTGEPTHSASWVAIDWWPTSPLPEA